MNTQLLISFLCVISSSDFASSAWYEFTETTNLLKSKSWTSSSCSKKRLLIDNKDSIALMVDDNLEFNELIFASDLPTEIILSETGSLSGKQEDEFKADNCEKYFTYKDPKDVPVWHDPSKWSFMNDSNDPQRPLLHVEKIPSQYDIVYFNPNNTYRVFIDVPARAGRLFIGGFSHTSETFLVHEETAEGRLQFHLSDDMDPDDFFSELILEASPPMHVLEKECEDHTGCYPYHMNSKIMVEICKKVTDCPSDYDIPCHSHFKPMGHCCNLCGGTIKYQTTNDYNLLDTKKLINKTMKSNAPEGRFSLLKVGDWEYQLILVKGRGDADFDPNWIKEKTEFLKQFLLDNVKGVDPDSLTMAYAIERPPYDRVALGICLFLLFCLLIGLAIGGYKKRTIIMNWFTSERIHLRALWRDDQGDRIHLELADNQSRCSIVSGMDTSFENPSFRNLLEQEKGKENMATIYESKVPTLGYEDKSGTSFENPSFNKLLEQEKRKEAMATIYETKVPSVPYEDKSSITFANPLFEGANAGEKDDQK